MDTDGPTPRARKQAVLVGVQRPKHGNNIGGAPGAYKDVQHLRDLLIENYQFEADDITILMDTDKLSTNQWPTADNIVKAMENLVEGKEAGDHIVFSFSGHGDQTAAVRDKNETDGLDEIVEPCDCQTAPNACGYRHYIRDDKIREIFVDQLSDGVHCTLIFDCCHSGTACDLPEVGDDEDSGEDGSSHAMSSAPGFRLSTQSRKTRNTGPQARCRWRGEASDPNTASISDPKEVTSWAACADEQVTYGGRNGGQFTSAFIDVIREATANGRTITHRDLLLDVRSKLADATRVANENMRHTSSKRYPIPRPQLGSLTSNSILDQEFTF